MQNKDRSTIPFQEGAVGMTGVLTNSRVPDLLIGK
jgi:hypothetical protein